MSGGAALPLLVEGVGQRFGRGQASRAVLSGVSFGAEAGEILAVVGASGCGKSTLLRLIGGLDAPSSGRVLVGDSSASGRDARTAFAFQEPRLLPWRSLEENVRLGLPPGLDSEEAAERVRSLLAEVGLADRASQRPRQVSGGMAQRVSLARALARRPGVLLLDEPFGALDALTRLRMQGLLLELHSRHPATVILVTHDVDEALALADRVLVLGTNGADDGAGLVEDIPVAAPRPRDRGGAEHAELRSRLLRLLGVDSAHSTNPLRRISA
ncbi:ABC transporter ATP-binding protein [Falsarthrobacter nasiphocae]|uniref:Sulfonate transport system ATP-binding protein n=1 Tax=Falsarthrobacter nasiphocae TaxID=189863 RepID=A0AAE3YHW9_9MICC|nr:ABC transporter ATP-binding protein [Falsarthrobacter nasiphocae]MDR6892243.1 sulfonate transport system ATP-binding protein [Falsarthrobacter nasiphocae]